VETRIVDNEKAMSVFGPICDAEDSILFTANVETGLGFFSSKTVNDN
jgi:hypothetical protein